MCKFTVMLLLVAAISAVNISEVRYYEELINREINKSLNYELIRDAKQYEANTTTVEDFGTFDYIIIGSGSAGSVTASRLSETNRSVLLLEAGTFENDFVDIPYMYWYLSSSRFNWGYESVPQKTTCLGMVDRKCQYPRGKGFGGSSLINGLVYARGNKLDFDLWENQGNPGWTYNDVLPYFIKQENVKINNAEEGYHGKSGSLNVEYSTPSSRQVYAFLDANVELGQKILDYNGKNQLGVSRCQLNTLNGTRGSSSRVFLFPALRRKNLRLSPGSFVTRILINNYTKTAYAVEFTRNHKKYVARASKEIVLSAGAIASPQILMLSGVGPAEHLNNLSIPLVRNLPVGENLDDHPSYFGFSVLSNYSEPIRSIREYIIRYLNQLSPYTIPGDNQGIGFFQTNLTNISGYPDIEILCAPSNSSSPLSQRDFGFTNESLHALSFGTNITSTFNFIIILLHPLSRGTIKLKSNDPFDYPLIDSKFLSDKYGRDIETMYEGIQLALRMLDTEAFKSINASLVKVVHPDCKSYKYLSKGYWYCTLRHFTLNGYHQISACKMGPNPLKGDVVDSKLRVYGIKKLRVADTSIIPFSLSGHPNAVAMMIGERVADFIISGL